MVQRDTVARGNIVSHKVNRSPIVARTWSATMSKKGPRDPCGVTERLKVPIRESRVLRPCFEPA